MLSSIRNEKIWHKPAAFLILVLSLFAYYEFSRSWRTPSREDAKKLIKEADELFLGGNFSTALKTYEQAWNEEHSPEAAVALTTVNYYLYENEEAKKWLELTPDSEQAAGWKNDFRLLLSQKPQYKWINLHLLVSCHAPSEMNPTGANLLLAHFDRKNAESYLSRASNLSPDCNEVQWAVAENIRQNRGINEALEFTSAELRKKPTALGSATAKAQLLTLKGELDTAKEILQAAIRADSKYLRSFLLLNRINKLIPKDKNYYARQRAYYDTGESIEMYTKLSPNDPFGYAFVGDEHLKNGDLGAAAKNYHKALSISPRIPGLNLQLAKISRQARYLDDALHLVEKELSIYPGSEDAIQFKDSLQKEKNKSGRSSKSDLEK